MQNTIYDNAIFSNDLWTKDEDEGDQGQTQREELDHRTLSFYEGQIVSVGKEMCYVHKIKKNKVILKSVRVG